MSKKTTIQIEKYKNVKERIYYKIHFSIHNLKLMN